MRLWITNITELKKLLNADLDYYSVTFIFQQSYVNVLVSIESINSNKDSDQ